MSLFTPMGSSNTAAPSTSGSLFGGGSGSLFGNAPTSTPMLSRSPSIGGGGLFGSTPASITTGGGGLFGSTPASTTTGGGGLFGSTPASTTTGGGGLFGSTPATQQNQPSLFGSSATSSSSSLLGSTNLLGSTGVSGAGTTPSSSLFGSSLGGGNQPQSSSLFGSSSTSGGMFGASPSSGGSLFGGNTGTSGGLFGTTNRTNQQQGSGSLLSGFQAPISAGNAPASTMASGHTTGMAKALGGFNVGPDDMKWSQPTSSGLQSGAGLGGLGSGLGWGAMAQQQQQTMQQTKQVEDSLEVKYEEFRGAYSNDPELSKFKRVVYTTKDPKIEQYICPPYMTKTEWEAAMASDVRDKQAGGKIGAGADLVPSAALGFHGLEAWVQKIVEGNQGFRTASVALARAIQFTNIQIQNMKEKITRLQQRHQQLTRSLLRVMEKIDRALAPKTGVTEFQPIDGYRSPAKWGYSSTAAHVDRLLPTEERLRQELRLMLQQVTSRTELRGRLEDLVVAQREFQAFEDESKLHGMPKEQMAQFLSDIYAHLEKQRCGLETLKQLLKTDKRDLGIIQTELHHIRIQRARGSSRSRYATPGYDELD